jgi:hypothetical protein
VKHKGDENNADEQKQQIEILWEALKILRDEARYHMNGNAPVEDEDYFVWSGRAWAAWDFVDKLIDQRLGLLVQSLQVGSAVDVGELEEMSAALDTDHNTGPYFNAELDLWLSDATARKCDDSCRYLRWPRFDRKCYLSKDELGNPDRGSCTAHPRPPSQPQWPPGREPTRQAKFLIEDTRASSEGTGERDREDP